mmetsp:Transcript_3967/g.16842  ORF Transcript_3967/g.16842 Transcript_3967/m.16842 type:complete len:256 (+) Transcript_3967:33-800(+)
MFFHGTKASRSIPANASSHDANPVRSNRVASRVDASRFFCSAPEASNKDLNKAFSRNAWPVSIEATRAAFGSLRISATLSVDAGTAVPRSYTSNDANAHRASKPHANAHVARSPRLRKPAATSPRFIAKLVTPLLSLSSKPLGRTIVYEGHPLISASFGDSFFSNLLRLSLNESTVSASPRALASMRPPNALRNLYAGESRFLDVTPAPEMTTRRGTLFSTHARATAAKPRRSTASGSPRAGAVAAKTTSVGFSF